ncbi:MAG: hypothetical protein ABI808_16115 [Pseudonocardiales bacterium]
MNTHDDVDERIRAALRAAALEIDETGLRAVPAPSSADNAGPAQHRARWLAPLLAAAAVIGVVIGTAVIANSPSAHRISPGGPTNSVAPTPLPSDTVAPTETRSPDPGRTPVTTVSARKPPTSQGAGCLGLPIPACEQIQRPTFEPLWPFPDYAAAKAWQDASKSGGAQPWHVDAGQTALLFAQNYLGFADITMVTSTSMDDLGAHIGVGYRQPDGQLHTAAVLHLVRYSPTLGDTTAGWEVVGSDDTDFSLEQPTYGSQVNSPMTVGGHITGVDENIVVAVRDQSGGVVSSPPGGLPAGGQNSPWQLTVPFQASGVLTVVAFTGGHLTQHERFAIQGVHS